MNNVMRLSTRKTLNYFRKVTDQIHKLFLKSYLDLHGSLGNDLKFKDFSNTVGFGFSSKIGKKIERTDNFFFKQKCFL